MRLDEFRVQRSIIKTIKAKLKVHSPVRVSFDLKFKQNLTKIETCYIKYYRQNINPLGVSC